MTPRPVFLVVRGRQLFSLLRRFALIPVWIFLLDPSKRSSKRYAKSVTARDRKLREEHRGDIKANFKAVRAATYSARKTSSHEIKLFRGIAMKW